MVARLVAISLPLLVVWAVLFGTLWLLGLLPWRPPGRVTRWFDRWGSFDASELGGFHYRRFILISAIGLFLELLLIRWLSSEIRIFAYFKNLVLVGCFFGFGVGCYLSRRRIQLLNTLLPLMVLAVIPTLPWPALKDMLLDLSALVGGLADVHVWDRVRADTLVLYAGSAVAFSVLIPMLTLATVSMIPMGQLVARAMEEKGDIRAYTANVAAGMAGIWAFTALSFVSAPPAAWFALFGVVVLLLVRRLARLRVLAAISLVGIAGAFLLEGRALEYNGQRFWQLPSVQALGVEREAVYWSPYQKLALTVLSNGTERIRVVLQTNGSWYQEIMDLSPSFVAKYPEYYEGGTEVPLPYHRYNFPYRFAESPKNVLILGTGMGNDVAAALRNGAQRVVAVEIDPLIVDLGREYHPEKPYSDPRVEVVIDDARNFVQNTHERFDLVVSSILDSHTTQSSFTNIRTDNYVYTREGLIAMKALLAPRGVLSLSFSGERPWFGGRLRNLLEDTPGPRPVVATNGNMFFFVGETVQSRLESDPALKAFVASRPEIRLESAEPTTDDWPYFYQQQRGIPMVVLLLTALLLLLCTAVLRGGGLSVRHLQWHFFFLGAGFILMEVQIISRLALVFGTTWLVNAIAISVILLLGMLANVTVQRLPGSARKIAYPGLFLALIVCYVVPMQALLFENWWLRATISTLVMCSPVYFAGLIFADSFAQSRFQAEAFGSNIFGAVVGGLLEALSFTTGLRALLIVAGLCYLGSLLAKRIAAAPSPTLAPAPSILSEPAQV